jgi:hypothetical protein
MILVDLFTSDSSIKMPDPTLTKGCQFILTLRSVSVPGTGSLEVWSETGKFLGRDLSLKQISSSRLKMETLPSISLSLLSDGVNYRMTNAITGITSVE